MNYRDHTILDCPRLANAVPKSDNFVRQASLENPKDDDFPEEFACIFQLEIDVPDVARGEFDDSSNATHQDES